ncbi:MAG: S9 family peptidase [Bacteroidales bacterium]|jgi:oligopeptidase B|nr:S9 family peptidase [Bacteroidales bacterium]
MKSIRIPCLLLAALLILFSCTGKRQLPVILTEADFPAPPMAMAKPDTFQEFGRQRIDNFFWMKDKTNPELMNYLLAENAYCDTVMARTREMQETLYNEFRSRIKEDDQSVPSLNNGYYYYSRTIKDKNYPVYCRKQGDTTATEEVIFDVNQMAEGYDAFLFAGYSVSPDNRLAAFAFNTTGSYAEFDLKVKDLTTGKYLDDEIKGVSSFDWTNDSRMFFYSVINESLRSDRILRHKLGDKEPDKLIYEEDDELFSVYVSKSKTKDFIFINSSSFNTSEVRLLSADRPLSEPKIFLPRKNETEYEVLHHKSCFYVLYKDPRVINSMLYQAPLTGYEDMGTWKVVVEHDPEIKIQDVSVFDSFLGLFVRANGLNEIRILSPASGDMKQVTFPEPVYNVNPMSVPEYTSAHFRYSYSSLNRPNTVYDYDTEKNTSRVLKVQEIPGGFNPDDYVVERLWAAAADSVKVPMAIVYKKGLKRDGKNPALLEGYGSYGYSTDADFSISIFSLVDRGFISGIAQVRGGSEMGEEWYEDGKMMNKMNTFTDFIACAETLVKEGYTSPSLLGIMGGSAGGLLMGAVANMRPYLFNVVIARAPFVDIINTMLDESLPLTTLEYEQWGNPNEEAAFKYMISYSPYDNVKAMAYPNILVTTGWNDSQVLVHEPAKWTARLRAMKTDDNLLLLKTNMDSGHGGATGRYDYLKELAFIYAFLADRMGK